jgi:hypothetical protein
MPVDGCNTTNQRAQQIGASERRASTTNKNTFQTPAAHLVEKHDGRVSNQRNRHAQLALVAWEMNN